ncbi:MAG: hypothetical protein J7M05_00965 [Anaerolineae bacterium]|nr:hypothetical protein [Anaerolineae bacterium]
MNVLVATKERLIFEKLQEMGNPKVNLTPALDTGRIYTAIPSTQLAIIDYFDLVPHPFSIEFIRKLLAAAPLIQCSSAEFLASPQAYWEQAPHRVRPYQLPTKYTIAFTSYSGGTGKTSLSLDTALRFAERTRARLQLPVAVLEFAYGHSALQALIGEEPFALSELITQPELSPYTFHGVTLYPMDYANVRALAIEQVSQYMREQIANHVLTVIDAIWPHGLLFPIGDEVDLWIVLTTPRLDAVENARRLREELAQEYGEEKVILAVNQMGGLAASLALWGTPRELELPRAQRSEAIFKGKLGKEILKYLYGPLWREYERAGRRRWWPFKARA